MEFVMKKYIFYLFMVNIVHIHITACCPFSFSPEDQRPFFEQYNLPHSLLHSECGAQNQDQCEKSSECQLPQKEK